MSQPLSLFTVGMILGGVITIAGVAIFWNSWDQARWQPLSGTVIDSVIKRVNEHTAGEIGHREYWKVSIHYTYTVAGKTYVSNTYSSSPPKSSARNNTPPSPELERLLTEYPPGRQVNVFVAPGNPERALLVPTRTPVWLPLAAGIAVLAITAVVF